MSKIGAYPRRNVLRFVVTLVLSVAIGNCTDATGPKEASPPPMARLDQPRALAVTESRWLDAGAFHTCAVKTDQTVTCWGSNSNGQSSVPAGLSSVTQIGAGGFHNCALKSNGTVTCWGLNHVGQASVPAGLSSVTSISVGSFHNCALKSDKTVVCWGANGDGESNVPAGLTDVASISAGGAHTCAVRTDGTAACWGRNNFGQSTIPSDLSTIVQISTGAEHTCALQTDHLDCWGRNDSGQGQTPPVSGLTVTQIAAGAWHNCAVTTDALLRCWGNNDFGQRQAPPLDPFVSVAAGTNHSCAAMADGTVMCWGDNTYGQSSVPAALTLQGASQQINFTSVAPNPGRVGESYTVTATGGGSGNPVVFESATPQTCEVDDSARVNLLAAGTCTITANQGAGNGYTAAAEVEQSFAVIQPLQVPALTPMISGGDDLACALKADGSVVCWGENAIQPPAGSSFVQISSGGLHSCGLKSDGTITCWGQNNFGQNTVPAGLGSVVQVAAGYNHTCVLKNDGTVACWGQNTLQQLAVPPGLTSVTQISTSASHTCARKADAQVVCWGDNSKGQATVPPFKSGDRVIAGGYHTCAELSGTASCWGEDDYNQLKFATLNGVSRFELGYHFTCRLNNGKVDCWGDNSRGQTTVPQLSDSVLGLSVGGYHACVFDNDGVVTCWALGRSVPAGLNLLGKQSQTIVFTSSAPSPGRSGETYAVTATGGASGNPVLFSSLTPDICEVTGNSVALTSIGRCTIAANQAGSDQYARAAQVIQSFDVVPSLERIPSIGAGGIHSCALQPNGEVICWGAVGAGGFTVPPSITNAVQLSVGTGYACVLNPNSTVACWGANGFGETIPPANLTGVTHLSAGGKMTCVVKYNGSVLCWGSETDGELNPPAGLNALSVSAGGDAFGCAIRTDRTVACWGFNGDGRATVPAGLANVREVSAGAQHACAVTMSGTVTCWGPNPDGRTSVPQNLVNVHQVSAGGGHTCALITDGRVTCWGLNTDGQAAPPSNLTSVQQIDAGQRHTCARRTDGKIVCWGWNGFNQTVVPSGLAPLTQAIVFTSTPPTTAVPGSTYNVTANGGASGNAVIFTSLTPGICDISGATVTLASLGTCTIAADQAGGNGYDAALQVSQTFEVASPFNMLSRCGHAITGIAFDGNDYFVGEGHDGLDQCVTRYTNGGVFVSTKHFQVDMRGLHFVPALGLLTSRTWAGQLYTMNYSAGTQQTFTGFVAALGVDQSQPAVDPDGVSYWVLDVPAQTAKRHRVSDNTVITSFAITGGVAAAPAIAVSDLLVFVPSGSTVRAYDKTSGELVNTIALSGSTEGCNGYGFGAASAGDRIMYSSTCSNAHVELITPVKSQSISIGSPAPSAPYVGGTYAMSATGGASGNPLEITAGPSEVCDISGVTVTLRSVGTCTIVVRQAGGNNYLRAPDQAQSFTVVKAPQTVAITSTPSSPTFGGSYSLTATGGASGNSVMFSSNTPAVCTITGATATFVAAGACTIAANQAGNAQYDAAPEATQTFTVAKAAQLVSFTTFPPNPALLGGSYVPAATSQSGSPVVFSAFGACTFDGAAVRHTSIGSCILHASAAGNANYLDGEALQGFSVMYDFTGFAAPIANAPSVNTATAGSVVRLKFSLAGNQGLDVIRAGSPLSGVLSGPCNLSGPIDSPTLAISAADLKYDPTTDQYQYSWQTLTSWAGTCRAFILILKDGASHVAHFQFNSVAKPTATLSVSPSTAMAGATTTNTFTLDIASPVPIAGITGLPCTLAPALQPNTLTYNGSCSVTTTLSSAGKLDVTATVLINGYPPLSSTVTITVVTPPAPTVELRASPTTMTTNSAMGVTMNLTISSVTPIRNIDSSKLVDNQLQGGQGAQCVFPQAAAGQTSYQGTCSFTIGPYSKSGKMNFSVPVLVGGRSATTLSNTVTITVTK